MDSPLYWRMAQALRHGKPALGPAHHGYPALIALASTFFHGAVAPGRAVSLLAAVLLMLVVYGLARRTLEPAWASLAVWLVALHPLLGVYGGVVMTESTVLALTCARCSGWSASVWPAASRWGRRTWCGPRRWCSRRSVRSAPARPQAQVPARAGGIADRDGAVRRLSALGARQLDDQPQDRLVRPTLGRQEPERGNGAWDGNAARRQTRSTSAWSSGCVGRLLRWRNTFTARPAGASGHAAALVALAAHAAERLGWTAWRRALLCSSFDGGRSAAPRRAVRSALPACWRCRRWRCSRGVRWLVAGGTPCLPSARAARRRGGGGRRSRRSARIGCGGARTAAPRRTFDDGPMNEMRLAGEWLRAQGPPGARA